MKRTIETPATIVKISSNMLSDTEVSDINFNIRARRLNGEEPVQITRKQLEDALKNDSTIVNIMALSINDVNVNSENGIVVDKNHFITNINLISVPCGSFWKRLWWLISGKY